MSSDSHMIGQVSFDLGFFSAEKNHELQETVSRLFYHEISRQIDLLFSETIAGDEILQIKQLSLDLGEISYSDLEKELPERIMAALKEKIAGLKHQPSKEAGNYKLLDSKSYKLNAIEHYLLTGNLLRKGTDIHSGIESYLTELLTEDPSLLIKLLKKIGKKERARMRIAWQFREKTIISIIHALEPAYREVISNYTRELELTESPVTTVQAQSEDFKRAKYFFALTYLFVEKGSVFNTRNFVRSLMKQLSAHYNMAYREFLLLMRRQIRQSPGTFSKGLELYIREIFMEDFELSSQADESMDQEELPDPTSALQIDSGDEAEECLFFFLENGSMPIHAGSMSPGRLQYVFLRLIEKKPQQVRELIQSKGIESTFLLISRYFSEKVIHALIGLYASSHSEWILSLTDSLLKLENLADLFEEKRLLKSLLFKATLIQLAKGSESTFHKAAFLEKLVSSLPLNSGLSLSELNARVKSGFEKSGAKEYSSLMTRLPDATNKQTSDDKPDAEHDGNLDSGMSSEQLTEKIAELQPAHSQWILSVKDLLLKAHSHEAIIAATHRTSAEAEIRKAIYNTTQNYTQAIFDRRDFFNRVLQALAENSTSGKTEFITHAKTAIDKAGGEAYSRLIDPKAYGESSYKTSGKNEELSSEEAIMSAIQKRQPEHGTWILSLHRVITAAYAFSPFASIFHKSTVRADLYKLLLQATESYSHPLFDQSAFFTQVLILISGRSPLGTHTFLSEAKKAIARSSSTSYANLIHTGPIVVKDELDPRKKEIMPQHAAEQSLTDRRELDILLYFLTHGESPWWSGIHDVHRLEYLWHKHFITKKKKRLLSFIKSHVTQESIRKNLLFFLDDDLSNNALNPGNQKNEHALPGKLIPQIRRSLTGRSSEAFIEAYLIYSFQKKEKKKEQIWADIHTLFTARGISVSVFYTELLTLQHLFTDLYLNDFFLLFHTKLSGELSLKKTSGEALRDESHSASPDYIRNEDEKKSSSVDRKETGPKKELLTSAPAAKADEHLPEFSKNPDKEPLSQRPAEKETLGYLELLLHFLNTANIPDNLDLNAKELILKVLSGIHKIRNHPNTRLFYLSLKNELLFRRFITPFNAKEQEKLMKTMFPDEYTFLKPYLNDFVTLFSNKNLKRQMDKDLVTLTSATFLFFIEYFRKNTGASEYIRFVAKSMFLSAAEYHSFSGLTKIAILRKEIQLQTFLPSMLLAMMQQEKKKDIKKDKPGDDTKQDLVFIENAGLILLWPFMSFYFEKLGLVSDHKFTSVKAAIRGACLLQYLVTGAETRQEHELPLNKVLCQLPKNHPVHSTGEFTTEEKDLSDELLKTAISRWEIIKNTSIEGLRNTFLKREGKLEWQDDKIILTVEPKSFDMLVDKIPWNISVIKLPWMKHTLHVKWR